MVLFSHLLKALKINQILPGLFYFLLTDTSIINQKSMHHVQISIHRADIGFLQATNIRMKLEEEGVTCSTLKEVPLHLEHLTIGEGVLVC